MNNLETMKHFRKRRSLSFQEPADQPPGFGLRRFIGAFHFASVEQQCKGGAELRRIASKAPQSKCSRVDRRLFHGFTLIELLMVMAIIGTVAALIFPATAALQRKQKIAVAQSELKQVETAIEDYKSKTGFYPPDNPGNPVLNQLYFELEGTFLTITNGAQVFITLDGSSQIDQGAVPVLYNNLAVVGFANCSKSLRGTDDAPPALNFLKGLKPNQIGQMVIRSGEAPKNTLLVCSVSWPFKVPNDPTRPEKITSDPTQFAHAAEGGLNPWCYVSTNPTNNPHSYDLWVDLLIKDRTYRVSNWSQQPQLLPLP